MAVRADAEITARRRGERAEYSSAIDALVQVLRLCLVTDSFLGQCCYRAKAALQARRVPLVPRLFHRMAVVQGQIAIGDPVVVAPGIYIPHGQVVADGLTRIGAGSVLFPFCNIGLRGGFGGPTLGSEVHVGTGAKVLGEVRVGDGARIGANAVVLDDVGTGARVVGVPARAIVP